MEIPLENELDYSDHTLILKKIKQNVNIWGDTKRKQFFEENLKFSRLQEKFSEKPAKENNVLERAKRILALCKAAQKKTKIFQIKTKKPLNYLSNYIHLTRNVMTEKNQLAFYPNFGDEKHELTVEKFGFDNFNKTLRGNLENDIILYNFIETLPENCKEKGLFHYHRLMLTDVESSFDNIKDAMIQRLNEKAKKIFIKVKLKYKSIKEIESLDEYHLVKTHKELFCRICNIYDCYHGIQSSDTFVGLHEENNCDLKRAEFFIEDYKNGKIFLKKNKDMKIREVLESLGSKNYYIPKQITFKCENDCFFERQFKDISQTIDRMKFSEIKTASIRLGIRTFSFQPCSIALMMKPQITCFEVYLYILNEVTNYNPFNQAILKKKHKKRKFFYKRKNSHVNSVKIANNQKNDVITYVPCFHNFRDKETSALEQKCLENCSCKRRGACDKYCNCDPLKCQLKRKGCECKSDCLTSKCPCYKKNSECDPDLCSNCFHKQEIDEEVNCRNNFIFFNLQKRTAVGISEKSGYGLFAIEEIQKNDYIMPYLGELLNVDEGSNREKIGDVDKGIYLFTYTDTFYIDGKYKGNKARFINHSKKKANCTPKTVFSKGEYHIAFYALFDIQPGTEIFFDYDGANNLSEKFPWINQEFLHEDRKENGKKSSKNSIITILSLKSKSKEKHKNPKSKSKRTFLDQAINIASNEFNAPDKKIKINDAKFVFKPISQEQKVLILPEKCMEFYQNLQSQRERDKNLIQLQMKSIFDLMGMENFVETKSIIETNKKNDQIVPKKKREEENSDNNHLTPVIEIEDDD